MFRLTLDIYRAALLVSASVIVCAAASSNEVRLEAYEIVNTSEPQASQVSVHSDVLDASRQLRALLAETPALKGKIQYRALKNPCLRILDGKHNAIKTIAVSTPGGDKLVEPLLFTSTVGLRVQRDAIVAQNGQSAVLVERRSERGEHGDATGAIGLIDGNGKILWQRQLPDNLSYGDVRVDATGNRIFALKIWTIGVPGPQEAIDVYDRTGDVRFSFPAEGVNRYRLRNLGISKNGKYAALIGAVDRKQAILFFDIDKLLQWSMPWSGTLGEIEDNGVYKHTEPFLGPSTPRTIDITEKLKPISAGNELH